MVPRYRSISHSQAAPESYDRARRGQFYTRDRSRRYGDRDSSRSTSDANRYLQDREYSVKSKTLRDLKRHNLDRTATHVRWDDTDSCPEGIPTNEQNSCGNPCPEPCSICPDFCTEEDRNKKHPCSNAWQQRVPGRLQTRGPAKPVRRPDFCCFDYKVPIKPEPCDNSMDWKFGTYCEDECGSGVVTKACEDRSTWCKTPLTVYQSTIGELGRKLLCGELKVPRRRRAHPPCNICEDVMPLCDGYYRKYDYIPPCEEALTTCRGGQKIYRTKMEQYWEPCDTDLKIEEEPGIHKFTAANAYLAKTLRDKQRSTFIPDLEQYHNSACKKNTNFN